MSGRAVIKMSQMGEEMQSQAVRVAQDGMGLCNTENVRGAPGPAYAKRRHASALARPPPVRSRAHSQEIAGHIKKSFQDAYACVRARSRVLKTRAARCRLILHSDCTRASARSPSRRVAGATGTSSAAATWPRFTAKYSAE